MNIRCHSWFAPNLSWADVCYYIINALDDLNHNTMVMSTNGFDEKRFKKPNKIIQSIIGLQHFGPGKGQIDLDFCYTVPQNFPNRFLSNSIKKAAIYNFEYKFWTPEWKKYYLFCDYFFPSSNFSAEIFAINGIPENKIFVIPHGVDLSEFNPSVAPIKLKTDKKFKFVSVCAPHARKKIDRLIGAYCATFKAQDDVCLVLKTKLHKSKESMAEYEINVEDIIKEHANKLGQNMPSIEVIGGRIDSLAGLYTACDVNITATGAEGWYMPGLESMAAGLINIAPNYSGQLHYMNPTNAILVSGKMVPAQRKEQYWGFNSKNLSLDVDIAGLSDAMFSTYKNYNVLKDKMENNIKETSLAFSWSNAAQKIIDVLNGNCLPYKRGDYRL